MGIGFQPSLELILNYKRRVLAQETQQVVITKAFIEQNNFNIAEREGETLILKGRTKITISKFIEFLFFL